MADLNEISIKARSKTHDFIWFSCRANSFNWFDNFKLFFNESEDWFNCTVLLDGDSFKLFFGKLYGEKTDHQNRGTYYTLQVAEGKRGSLSSQYIYKLIYRFIKDVYPQVDKPMKDYYKLVYNSMGGLSSSVDHSTRITQAKESVKQIIKDSTICQLLDKQFTEEYLQQIFPEDKNNVSLEVEEDTQNKLKSVIDDLGEVENVPSKEPKSKFMFDSFDDNSNLFLNELKRITTTETCEGRYAIIFTNQSIKQDDLKEFDYRDYGRVLCLTTNSIASDQLPLSVSVEEEPKVVSEPEQSSFKERVAEALKDKTQNNQDNNDNKEVPPSSGPDNKDPQGGGDTAQKDLKTLITVILIVVILILLLLILMNGQTD